MQKVFIFEDSSELTGFLIGIVIIFLHNNTFKISEVEKGNNNLKHYFYSSDDHSLTNSKQQQQKQVHVHV